MSSRWKRALYGLVSRSASVNGRRCSKGASPMGPGIRCVLTADQDGATPSLRTLRRRPSRPRGRSSTTARSQAAVEAATGRTSVESGTDRWAWVAEAWSTPTTSPPDQCLSLPAPPRRLATVWERSAGIHCDRQIAGRPPRVRSLFWRSRSRRVSRRSIVGRSMA